MANYGFQFKDKNGNNYYPCPFPVGFVVFTATKVNPSTYWGGTWVQVSGGYLYAASSSTGQSSYSGSGTQSKAAFTSGSTTLTEAQIPSHQHMVYDGTYGAGRWVEISGFNDTNGGMIPSIRQIAGAGTNSGRLFAGPTGGSKGHTHSIPAHSHNVAYVYVFMWKRTA